MWQPFSLSSDGLHIAIAALYNEGHGNGRDAGHVRMFSFDGTNWNQLPGVIDGENETDNSGQTVEGISLAKTATTFIVAVGASSDDAGLCAGHTRIFEYDGSSSWLQLGNDIDGLQRYEKLDWCTDNPLPCFSVSIIYFSFKKL